MPGYDAAGHEAVRTYRGSEWVRQSPQREATVRGGERTLGVWGGTTW